MNSVNLVGRLTRDPEVRNTPSGLDVSNFSLAVDRAGDKGDDGDYQSGFFDCTAFGKTAELINAHFHKGKQIAVSGRLQHHRWETNDGDKRSKVQITVDRFTFIGSRSDNEGGDYSSTREAEGGQQQFVPASVDTDFTNSDSDIPF